MNLSDDILAYICKFLECDDILTFAIATNKSYILPKKKLCVINFFRDPETLLFGLHHSILPKDVDICHYVYYKRDEYPWNCIFYRLCNSESYGNYNNLYLLIKEKYTKSPKSGYLTCFYHDMPDLIRNKSEYIIDKHIFIINKNLLKTKTYVYFGEKKRHHTRSRKKKTFIVKVPTRQPMFDPIKKHGFSKNKVSFR